MFLGETDLYDGGSYCYPAGMTGEHANPDINITVACSVEAGSGPNVLQWVLPDGRLLNLLNGIPVTTADGIFTSTITYYNGSIRTNATLSFTATSSLDNKVIQCNDGAGMSDSCTLKIKS